MRAGAVCYGLTRVRQQHLDEARALVNDACGGDLTRLANAPLLRALPEAATQALLRLGAVYLACVSPTAHGDPVARFHLDNGARLERLNVCADLSPKGVRQSFGMMVNYLYDLQKVEVHHEKFVRGEVAHSRAIGALL